MTNFTVNLYREMRLCFVGIEADTPEAAAAIAHGRPTDQADNIEDCNGDDISALVDVAGDEELGQSCFIYFKDESPAGAAPQLLTALEAIIDYAENEAYCLENLRDSPEAEAEADMAWKAVEAAREVIAQVKGTGISSAATEIDIHALLARSLQIASVWGTEDVHAIRPDLTDEQAWEILQAAERKHDATIGINWDVLAYHADLRFGPAPETNETQEA